MTDELGNEYDAVVIGGGAAGLNGALMLGRSRRSVAVVDAGEPRNAPAAAVHGLLAREGTPPAELLARGREEVRAYGGHVVAGEVAAAAASEDGFTVSLADGRRTRARRLLVAAGLADELPDVPGLRERWGREVLHCPYCHGWEVRDRPVAVLGSGPMSVHQAQLFRQVSDDVTYVTHTAEPPAGDDAERLAARGIRVVTGEVAAVVVEDDRLTGVRLADGSTLACAAVVVTTRMVARAGFLTGLGLHTVPHPSGLGEHIPTGPAGRTDVPGVWAAGNVTDMMAWVGTSAAAGAMAGAQINADLVEEETRAAVEEAREASAPAGAAAAPPR